MRVAARYADVMTHEISVTLDEQALEALRRIQAQGLTQSEAVSKSITKEAARIRDRRAIAAEAAALEADEADRAEIAAVARFMDELRAPW